MNYHSFSEEQCVYCNTSSCFCAEIFHGICPRPPHHLLILVCCAFTTDLLPYFDSNLLEIHNLDLVVNLSVYFMTETIQPYKILLRNCLSTYIFFLHFSFFFSSFICQRNWYFMDFKCSILRNRREWVGAMTEHFTALRVACVAD